MTSINLKVKYRLAGRFQLLVTGPDGNVKHDTGWFDNLITDQGLDWLGTPPPNYNTTYGVPYINTHCGVGTGNTTPAYTDTRLTSFLAMFPSSTGSNVEGFSSRAYVAGPPAYWSSILVYSFATGAVVGNIAEVGTGNTASTDTQPQLFSHALIVDGSGNPTTITVTSADALTVNYELRMYLDLTDNTYSISISGVTYSGTYRRAQVTSVPNYSYTLGHNINGTTSGCYLDYYNGTIGSVTSTPSGTVAGGPNYVSTTLGTYNLGSYYSSLSTVAGTTVANLSGGISAIMTTSEHGSYQFGLSPSIPKTSSQTLTINWNVSWARY
jgi:hypothetical protein